MTIFRRIGFWIPVAVIVLIAAIILWPASNQIKTADIVNPEQTVTLEDNKSSTSNQSNGAENVFTETINKNIISPSVSAETKEKLLSQIEKMKKMGPGVGAWRIIYYNSGKILLYNYSHIMLCDISEEDKGIYSIIDLSNLNVGSYQGSVTAMIYPSPDAMSCVIGSGCWEADYKNKTMNTYFCNFHDSSVNELDTKFNMAYSNVKWYRNMPSSTQLPWYVCIKSSDTEFIWDVEKHKNVSTVPPGASAYNVIDKYIDADNVDRFANDLNKKTGYAYFEWWQKDENTVLGAPYTKGVTNFGALSLCDFEIVEVNLEDNSVRILYRIDD